jgi:hypothetical protein
MGYNIRDLLGHFVKLPPKSNEDGMCPHACCKGKRRHPDNWPVMLSRETLRSASDEDLIQHFSKPKVGRNGAAVVQVTRELERRERAAEARERARGRRADKGEQYRLYLENQWVQAENDLRGNLVNKRGRAKGIDGRSLWTANDRTRAAYASEELRQWWDQHPIVSAREFQTEAEHHRGARRRRESRLYGVY